MKPRFCSLFIAIALLLSFGMAKAQIIVVQSGANATVFTDLDAAVAAATAGDYLYLSGGQFTLGGIAGVGGDSVNFYKPLHFIGAGINPDSTSVTRTTAL